MFVCSVRASTLRFFGAITLCLFGMLFLLGFSPSAEASLEVSGEEITLTGLKSNADRVALIEKCGVKVKAEGAKEESFTLPDNFDLIISGYNEIQKSQGLDLTKYKGKRVTHYAYLAEGYDYEGEVYVNLYIYKNRLIGADVSSANPKGFVKPLILKDT